MKKLFTLIMGCAATLATLTVSANPVVSCDTLTNLTSRDTLTYYLNPYGGIGYLSGNNGSGDLEKAEQFSGPLGSTLTGAFIGFGYANILAADSATTVTINAYSATAGAPGATIATTTVTMGQIAAAVTAGQELYVTFNTPPTLTAQEFFISVVLPTTGDTIVLLTNTMAAQDGKGWEQWASGTWHPYNEPGLYNFPNELGNDIQAVTCGGAPLAAFQSSLLVNFCVPSQTIDFYNTSSNGVDSIRWSFPGGTPATSTVANPVVTYSTMGNFNVQLVAYGPGANDTSTAVVYVSPPVTDSIRSTPANGPTGTNGTATVTVLTGTPPYSYSWSDSNQDVTPAVTGLAPGTYTVNITDSNFCSVIDTVVVSYVNGIISCCGPDRPMEVFPNPAIDVLNILWGAATTADLTITDVSGRVLGRYSIDNSTSRILDISQLTAGIYILSIRNASSRTAQSVRFTKL